MLTELLKEFHIYHLPGIVGQEYCRQ